MANSELFVLGDARFLSGGAPRSNNTTYNEAPPRVAKAEAVTTRKLLAGIGAGTPFSVATTRVLATNCGQSVHCGRDSYHEHEWHSDRCGTRPNIFIAQDDVPTAGVEIETYARNGVDITKMRQALWSNWFHFEEDGSLDRTVGHELITDVLPPRVYRDLRTWVGLQNLTAPWLESFSKDTTGLHVHVGVQQFEKCDLLPVTDVRDRVILAKFMIAFCYHGLLDAEFLDRVFLRKGGHYCAASADKVLLADVQQAREGRLLAGDLADRLAERFAYQQWQCESVNRLGACSLPVTAVKEFGREKCSSESKRWMPNNSLPSRYNGHSVELNMPHPYTIEFRRGKGTLNAISVHRMVELVTLVTRYVWKACREPDMETSPYTLYGFIADNTCSEALKAMAREQIGKLPKKARK